LCPPPSSTTLLYSSHRLTVLSPRHLISYPPPPTYSLIPYPTLFRAVDTLVTNLDCVPGTPGNQTTNLTIAVGGSITCTGTHTVTQAELATNRGGVANIENPPPADSNQTHPNTAPPPPHLSPSPTLSL